MDGHSIAIIVALACLLLLSAYFSATETAFSSLNRIRLKNMAAAGHPRAQKALELSEDYDTLLSTILIGNNIVNIASASIATVIFVKWFGDLGVTLSTVVMTVLVLIFGEISPKSLAKEAPERFALFSTPFMVFFIRLLSPLNFLFRQWKRFLNCLFQIKDDQSITEEELLTIVDEAQQEGGINQQEGQLIRSAIEFNDLEAIDIITPRVDIVGVDQTAGKEEISRIFMESGFSRLPVFDDSIDDIVGVINQKDFFAFVLNQGRSLKSIIKPGTFIAPSMKLSSLLKLLQKTKSHFAVVIDEFGGTEGIVTLEDVLEELVGEIWDEHDEEIKEIEKLAENRYRINGGASADDFFEFFQLTGEADVATVAGWVTEQLNRIPAAGETFRYQNLQITVNRVENRRVLEISVEVQPESGEESESSDSPESRTK